MTPAKPITTACQAGSSRRSANQISRGCAGLGAIMPAGSVVGAVADGGVVSGIQGSRSVCLLGREHLDLNPPVLGLVEWINRMVPAQAVDVESIGIEIGVLLQQCLLDR